MLARQRLTEAQLWQRLERKGLRRRSRCARPSSAASATASSTTGSTRGSTSRASARRSATTRLVGELVRKGIDRERGARSRGRAWKTTKRSRCAARLRSASLARSPTIGVSVGRAAAGTPRLSRGDDLSHPARHTPRASARCRHRSQHAAVVSFVRVSLGAGHWRGMPFKRSSLPKTTARFAIC